jgi:hypothetical protein
MRRTTYKVLRARMWSFALCAVLALVMMAEQAQSQTISVDGQIYSINLIQDQSFDANAATLRSSPWWGSSSLAQSFANAYATQVGVPTTSAGTAQVYFGYAERTTYSQRFDTTYTVVNSAVVDESGGPAFFADMDAEFPASNVRIASPSAVPEINAGSLAQAMLILFALWLVVRRRTMPLAA